MSKTDTMYADKMRLTKLKQLDTYNLNPFSCWGVVESYIKNIAPLPIKFTYYLQKKDKKKDSVVESKGVVEMYLSTPGYVGNKKGDISKLSGIHATLFCRSYYEGLRPMAVSFQLADCVDVHLRTPGVSDSDKIAFNPFYETYNPTQTTRSKKKKE